MTAPDERPTPTAPPAPGTTGPDLLNAARDTLISDELPQLSDAELIEQAQASRDLASMATGRQYRTLAELLRRRQPRMKSHRFEAQDARRDEAEGIRDGAPNRPNLPIQPSEEAAGEIALAFTLTDYSAGIVTAMVADLARRLPCALEGLEAGRLDEARVKIIWEYSRDLFQEGAVKFDSALSPRAGEMTTGELRDRARREQIRIDPGAAEKRRKRGERTSKVTVYPNDDHTATLAIEHAPADLAAAAKSRVSAIARAAKASGARDDLSLLESKVSLGLLTGTLDVIPPAEPPGGGPEDPGPDDTRPGGNGRGGGSPESGGTRPAGPASEGPRPGATMPWPKIPGNADAARPGCAVVPPACRPKNPGRLRLLVPWRTIAGLAGEPGDLSWFGAVTPSQARELARSAAGDPTAAWRVIVTGDEGRAIAVTTVGRRSHGPGNPAPGLVEEITITVQASLAATLDSSDKLRETARRLCADPDPWLTAKLLDVITAANQAAAEAELRAMLDGAAGGCAHTAEVPGYRIPDTMRRHLCSRDRTCRNPVCRRRAAQCDVDHTLAYDQGGRTCTCNTGALCRHHHRLKQCPGWALAQEPGTGTFTWTTPAGLRYHQKPHRYAV